MAGSVDVGVRSTAGKIGQMAVICGFTSESGASLLASNSITPRQQYKSVLLGAHPQIFIRAQDQ